MAHRIRFSILSGALLMLLSVVLAAGLLAGPSPVSKAPTRELPAEPFFTGITPFVTVWRRRVAPADRTWCAGLGRNAFYCRRAGFCRRQGGLPDGPGRGDGKGAVAVSDGNHHFHGPHDLMLDGIQYVVIAGRECPLYLGSPVGAGLVPARWAVDHEGSPYS